MQQPPERIYNWLNTQLSIARFYGGCTYNGARYTIAHGEDGEPLVRTDVLQRERRLTTEQLRKHARREKEKWVAAQESLLPPNA